MVPEPIADLEAVLRRTGLVGDVAAVAAASPATGVVVWTSGHLGPGVPVTTGTPFYAASVTKQVTGALAARAVLAGRLDPDASITEHLPDLPRWAAAVRVRHLIHHTGGLPTTGQLAVAVGVGGEGGLDNALVLDGLRRWPGPLRAPGTAFAYSNTGYVLLAEVVRAVDERDLSDLAREVVFDPSGMVSSHLGGPAQVLLPALPPPPETIGDRGLWTSASDLLRWLQALNDQRLGAALTRTVQTPGRLDDGTALAYAWGMTARTTSKGVMYTHGGNWPGWAAKTVRQPVTGTAVAVLARSDDVPLVSDTASAVHQVLAGYS